MAQSIMRTLLLMYMSVWHKDLFSIGSHHSGHQTTGHLGLFVQATVNQCSTSTRLTLGILGFLSLQVFHVLIYI